MAKSLIAMSIIALAVQSLGFQILSPTRSCTNSARAMHPSPVPRSGRQTQANGRLHAKKSNNNVEKQSDSDSTIFGAFKKSPGTIIIIPFVALFGLDLIANIAVVTKRSLEGKLTYSRLEPVQFKSSHTSHVL
jgi:hypothetical protein